MHQPRDEDLFQESTMTFGEHLEELRACLFKALIGLVIGVAIGLLIGQSVVRFIQRPLEKAMINYYAESAVQQWEQTNKERLAMGLDVLHPPSEVEDLIMQGGMIPEDLLIEVDELVGQLQFANPEFGSLTELPANPPGHPLSKIGPTTIIPGDLKDPAALCRQLVEAGQGEADASSRPAARVWERLSAAQRDRIRELAAEEELSDGQLSELSGILSSALDGVRLYDAAAFAGVEMRPEAERLLKRQDRLSAEERLRLGRLLLESVFPQQLAATHADFLQLKFWRPVEKSQMMRPVTLNAQEAFMIYMKASIVTGIVLSSPWVFFQLWSFVAAGLYRHEKRYVYIFLPFSLALFLAGASLAFFFVFEPVLTFLFSFNRRLNIDPTPRISEWLSFVLLLPLGFGISFQLPLVMLFLERIGIFTVDAYTSKWRIAVFAIFIIAAILTPADPWSMVLMAAPLTVLYYLGVMLCRYLPRGHNPYAEPA